MSEQPEERVQQLAERVAISEQNELFLFRKLSPYLDAEIENRDAEIERLRAEIASLKDGSPAAASPPAFPSDRSTEDPDGQP